MAVKKLLTIGTFVTLTAFAFAGTALAGKKSSVKVHITGETENGLVDSNLTDTAKDLTGHLQKHVVIVPTAEEADLVIRVMGRGRVDSGDIQVKSSFGGLTTVASNIEEKILRITVSLRDRRSQDFEAGDGGGEFGAMVGWKGVAGLLAKQVRKFIEANEAGILGVAAP